jgi:hypothetical protein
VLTIARLWPQWHVLTRAVAGVIETPFQMGDRMYEFVGTPSGPYEFEWQSVEFDCPRRAKLQAEDGTAIIYTLEARADGKFFWRVMFFPPTVESVEQFYSSLDSGSERVQILIRWPLAEQLSLPGAVNGIIPGSAPRPDQLRIEVSASTAPQALDDQPVKVQPKQ